MASKEPDGRPRPGRGVMRRRTRLQKAVRQRYKMEVTIKITASGGVLSVARVVKIHSSLKRDEAIVETAKIMDLVAAHCHGAEAEGQARKLHRAEHMIEAMV